MEKNDLSGDGRDLLAVIALFTPEERAKIVRALEEAVSASGERRAALLAGLGRDLAHHQ
jgi:hypothetical protein